MDRREIVGERRSGERRAPFRPVADERRSGFDRRSTDRRDLYGDRRRVTDRRLRAAHEPVGGRRRTDWVAALPPRSRLVPALLVVAVTLADLAVAQVTEANGWPLLFIAAAFPLVAYDLANPGHWRRQLVIVWVAVSVFVLAAGVNIGYMVAS
ncbi:MAG: hypothetical protein JO248_04595 [Acidimicrobiia bacterium]|nr:hypothetical protein [Acidimicrobiia bacterium]MBV8983701.1 hypothetical protein [Acidimicrobiia bacterium]